jgi:hypothetical protein
MTLRILNRFDLDIYWYFSGVSIGLTYISTAYSYRLSFLTSVCITQTLRSGKLLSFWRVSSMICEPCTKAGQENQANHYKRAAHWHEKCESCVCQHKTGQGWVKGEKVELMQRQSP